LPIIEQYNWPGNVSELEHVIRRAALKVRSRQMEKKIIAIESADCGSLSMASNEKTLLTNEHVVEKSDFPTIHFREETDRFQRNLIRKPLTQEGGNWAAAARK
jgi:anaerobic nitric oxide reductase transcription regulator